MISTTNATKSSRIISAPPSRVPVHQNRDRYPEVPKGHAPPNCVDETEGQIERPKVDIDSVAIQRFRGFAARPSPSYLKPNRTPGLRPSVNSTPAASRT